MKTPYQPGRGVARPSRRAAPAPPSRMRQVARPERGAVPARQPEQPPEKATEKQRTAAPAGPFLPAVAEMVLVAAPLLPLALALLLSNNFSVFVANHEESAVFRVVLAETVDQQTAQELAAGWEGSTDWASARFVPATETFLKIEALRPWMEDAANSAIIDPMPGTVDLRPADFFGGSKSAEELAQPLEQSPLVSRVFYDAEFLNWLKGLCGEMRNVRNALVGLFSLLGVAAAFFTGWGHGRLFRFSSSQPSAHVSHWGPPAVVCASGAFALALTACAYGLFVTSSHLEVRFLSIPQSLFVVLFGVGLGALVWAARRGWDQPRASSLQTTAVLPLLLGLSAILSGGAFADPAELALPDNSLRPSRETTALPRPPREGVLGAIPQVSGGDAEKRTDQLARCLVKIAEKERLIRYHEEWLRRSDEEGKLDEQNRLISSRKIEAARTKLRMRRQAVDAREDALRRLREGMALTDMAPPGSTVVPADGAQAARVAVRGLMAREAVRSYRMLREFDRPSLERAELEVEVLLKEAERLEAFRQNSELSPDAVRAEVGRLEEDVRALVAQRNLLRAPPRRLTPRPTPALLLPILESDKGVYLSVAEGTLIHAVAAGKVLQAEPFRGRGAMITIDHGAGLSSLYSYLTENDIGVAAGDSVRKGQCIGSAGAPKDLQGRGGIRFEVRKDGKIADVTALQGVTRSRLRLLLTGRSE